jgi:hypothetical protein
VEVRVPSVIALLEVREARAREELDSWLEMLREAEVQAEAARQRLEHARIAREEVARVFAEGAAADRDGDGVSPAPATAVEPVAGLTPAAPVLREGYAFHVDTVLGTRLYAMAFLEHGTRRLHITGVTRHPTGEWVTQQARNLAADLGTRVESLRFVLRDRDAKYTASFDAVFEAEDMDVLLSAPRAPRMNAHCERVIGTVRREVLDHVLVLNEAHARRVLAEYQDHYNGHRPHRAREQRSPDEVGQPVPVHDLDGRRLLRTRVLGGVINEYRYAS